MAVKHLGTFERYIGAHGDSKPSGPAGSTFYETDTGATYIYDGSAWQAPIVGTVQSKPFTATDASSTVTVGGTAQNIFSATPTNGFEICNPDASEDLWISDSTTAAANATGCFRVAAGGGTYVTPPGYKPLGDVSIVGATTGHKFTARRW